MEKNMTSLSIPPKAIYSGNTRGYRVEWTSDDLSAQRAQDTRTNPPSFSARDRFNTTCSGPAPRPLVCDGFRSSHTFLKAQVGSFLSIRQSDFAHVPYIVGREGRKTYIPGDGTAWGKHYLTTIDMVSGKPTTLTQVFPESDIFRALLQHPWIQTALATPEVKRKLNNAPPRNFDQLKQALAGWQEPTGKYTFRELGDHFAFQGLKLGSNVTVRLSLPPGNDHWLGHITTMDIDLPVPDHLKKDFARAALPDNGSGEKAGLLGDEADRRFRDSGTYIEKRQEL